MKPVLKTLALAALFITGPLIAAENQTTLCTFGANERKIEVVYPEGTETPCEVQYTKNGEMKVLWNAKAELGYCESKAAAFVEKQKSWGWDCRLQKPEENNETEAKQEASETVQENSEN